MVLSELRIHSSQCLATRDVQQHQSPKCDRQFKARYPRETGRIKCAKEQCNTRRHGTSSNGSSKMLLEGSVDPFSQREQEPGKDAADAEGGTTREKPLSKIKHDVSLAARDFLPPSGWGKRAV